MSPLSTDDLHRIFESLDQNGDGLISLEELSWLLERTTGVHASEEELASFVGEMGLNCDDFSNFYNSILSRDEGRRNDNEAGERHEGDEATSEDLYRAFQVFDMDGDGLISSEELKSVLWRLGFWNEQGGMDCDRIISKYDINCDGVMDFEEFKRMMLINEP